MVAGGGPEFESLAERARRRRLARDTAVVAVTVLALAALLIFVWFARPALIWLIASAFLAVSIEPLVRFLQGKGAGRGLAITVAFLTIGAGLLMVAFVIVPPVLDGARALKAEIPQYVDQLRQTAVAESLNAEGAIGTAGDATQRIAELFGGANKVFDLIGAVVGGAFAIFMIFTFTVYFLIYGRGIRTMLASRLSEYGRPRFLRASSEIYRMNRSYWYGKFFIAMIAGLTCFVSMKLLAIPYAAPLSFFVAITDLIPNIGATLGMIPVVAVALLDEPWKGAAILVILVLYQQFENTVLTPKVFKAAIELHPFVSFTAVAVLGMVFGLMGALLAIPVVRGIQIAVGTWRSRTVEAGQGDPVPSS